MRWTTKTWLGLIGLALPAVCAGAATANPSKIHSSVSFGDDGRAEVIVCVLDPLGDAWPDCSRMEAVLGALPPERTLLWDCPDSIVAELTRDECLAIAARPDVHSIVPHLRLRPMLDDVVEIVRAIEAWDAQMDGAALTGAGRTVCVVDTGVDWTHPDLAGKNIAGVTRDCTAGLDCPGDPDAVHVVAHGTHVAGIVGAEGGIDGVGVGTNIIDLKVFVNGEDMTSVVYVKRALEWVVNHHEEYDVSVVSLSISSDELYSDHCDGIYTPITTRIDAAVAAGVAVVIATGNSGSTTKIGFPACKSNAIPVSSTTKLDYRAGYANYNSLVKIFGTGSTVLSTCFNGSYCMKSGTSMATPCVSGGIAIVQQALGRLGVALHPLDIEDLLYETGAPIKGLPDDYARIDVKAAVDAVIDRYADPADLNLDGAVRTEDLLLLVDAWGPCPTGGPEGGACRPDLDGDGVVGMPDLLALLRAWAQAA